MRNFTTRPALGTGRRLAKRLQAWPASQRTCKPPGTFWPRLSHRWARASVLEGNVVEHRHQYIAYVHVLADFVCAGLECATLCRCMLLATLRLRALPRALLRANAAAGSVSQQSASSWRAGTAELTGARMGQKRPRMTKIGTHSGTFHCDEALGCYLLLQTKQFEDAEIVRRCARRRAFRLPRFCTSRREHQRRRLAASPLHLMLCNGHSRPA